MTIHRAIVIAISALALCAQPAAVPPRASDLKDPAGQKVEFRFRTLPNSVQIYTCRQTNLGYAWAGPDPDAVMVSADKKLTVHHYKGPTWEATDGSIVRSEGPLAKHFSTDSNTAVDWLELPAKSPSGKFAKVTFIHRIETSGGVAPAKTCDVQHAGDQERVSYSATYLFYVPK